MSIFSCKIWALRIDGLHNMLQVGGQIDDGVTTPKIKTAEQMKTRPRLLLRVHRETNHAVKTATPKMEGIP